MYSKAFIGFFG